MFTVARPGVTGRLRRSLTTTNRIESMISITRTTTGRVKNGRDGTMKKRWIAAGMLETERSFRRLKGHADMPNLVAAIAGPSHPSLSHPPTTLRWPERVRDHHRTSTRSRTSSTLCRWDCTSSYGAGVSSSEVPISRSMLPIPQPLDQVLCGGQRHRGSCFCSRSRPPRRSSLRAVRLAVVAGASSPMAPGGAGVRSRGGT
jgi:hypothetical protein